MKNSCGFWCVRPQWLQKYATSRSFLVVYGLLGTIQAMGYVYFLVTLSTIEKRFKIPSQTTGIILSGNEVSQILLSLILSYAGGQRNRPVWIAWGVVFCSLSCFILAAPHFIYGAGEEVQQLTLEYLQDSENVTMDSVFGKTEHSNTKENSKLCLISERETETCDKTFSYLPLVLIFLSQFVLGIGNTLYYALGQAYLDDNTHRSNTPLVLSYAISLRMFGPVLGFFLGFVSLNMFIDPTKTPIITKTDPRWLGAWWFGWIILGASMICSAAVIGLFPKHLPKKKEVTNDKEAQEYLRSSELKIEVCKECDKETVKDVAHVKEFMAALMRLFKNKLLMYNITSNIFYLIGAAGHMTFISRYMEVQFNKTSSDGTIVTGPITITGMVLGFLISGFVISTYKPRPRILFFWNVIVGVVLMMGQCSYMFLHCDSENPLIVNGSLDTNTMCNSKCGCNDVPYSPVCHIPSGKTYFSPCHAGCTIWNKSDNNYLNCSCVSVNSTQTSNFDESTTPSSTLETTEKMLLFHPIEGVESHPTTFYSEKDVKDFNQMEITSSLGDISTQSTTEYDNLALTANKKRIERSAFLNDLGVTIPGVCFVNCNAAFYGYTIISLIVNWLSSTGRIGNILLNFRAVDQKDKAFAQGLALTLVSLLALIPGPIIFGRIIDNTCLVWGFKCGKRGNCQLYDQKLFRFSMNGTAMSFIFIGVLFDALVWYYSKNMILYDENEKDPCLETLKNCKCKCKRKSIQ